MKGEMIHSNGAHVHKGQNYASGRRTKAVMLPTSTNTMLLIIETRSYKLNSCSIPQSTHIENVTYA